MTDPANVKLYTGKDGHTRRYCLLCSKLRQKAHRDRKKNK